MVLATGDAHELPVAVLVGLGAAYCHEDTGGLGDDVGQVESRLFAGSQRRGVTEQDDGAVADADRHAGVDGGHDLVEFGDGERVWAWRRGAVPRIRRSPRQTRRTRTSAVGSGRPSCWCRWAIAEQ